jgi:hypothetical protein
MTPGLQRGATPFAGSFSRPARGYARVRTGAFNVPQAPQITDVFLLLSTMSQN